MAFSIRLAWRGGELPHRFKLVTPGNHEFFLESDPFKRNLISNAIVLINEEVEIMGLKIWGSPTTPLYGGAFGLSVFLDKGLQFFPGYGHKLEAVSGSVYH